MGRRKESIEETKEMSRKFVRYREGAEMYGMGISKFQQMAKEACATYKIDKMVLVNIDRFEQYLETFAEF